MEITPVYVFCGALAHCYVASVEIGRRKQLLPILTQSLMLGDPPGVGVRAARRHRLFHAEGAVGQEERHSALGYVRTNIDRISACCELVLGVLEF